MPYNIKEIFPAVREGTPRGLVEGSMLAPRWLGHPCGQAAWPATALCIPRALSGARFRSVRWRRLSPEAARVEVLNPSDGGFWFWLFKFYAFAALCLGGLGLLGGIGLYAYFASTLPALPDFDRYRLETAESTRVRAWDGTDLAELASERREILPLEAFPQKLLQAFVAIEDRRFYEHSGLDYRGMLRALVANLRAGHVVQGGSTITQQVARSFLHSSEQTMQRKIREAILARRLEARYEKNQILALYLNQIFLGHQSYGVAAAARRYFNKQVSELDLAEMATLAGIVQAPSRYSPLLAPDLTRARRDQVLAAMATAGVIDEATADNLRARPLAVAPAARRVSRALALLRRARAPGHRQALR